MYKFSNHSTCRTRVTKFETQSGRENGATKVGFKVGG